MLHTEGEPVKHLKFWLVINNASGFYPLPFKNTNWNIMTGTLSESNVMPINGAAVFETLPRPVTALHFSTPIIIGDGSATKRLEIGMQVKIASNSLVDCTDLHPTHEIIFMWRNLSCSFAQIKARDLKTGDVISINPLQ